MLFLPLALALSLPADDLQPPVMLEADGQVIDIADHDYGYSGPWITDVNGDGRADLVVTSIRGTLRWYENTSTTNEPEYTHKGLVKRGEKDLKFWNW